MAPNRRRRAITDENHHKRRVRFHILKKGKRIFGLRLKKRILMAPNRRKSAKNRGYKLDWKLGELVFAKVKGYPTWPAKVDEPTKWGFPVEENKVFVHFFGSSQLGFCNPVDVEAFTEEKMEQLRLKVKCQTKGSDFVRAVHEINEYFEKLKGEDRSTNVGEVTMPNGSNSAESLADSYMNGEASKETNGTYRESTDSNKIKLGDVISVGEASASAKQDPILVEETPFEDPTCNANEIEMPPPKMYAIKNQRVTQAQNFITEKRVMSARWSRSSSRDDPHKLRSPILPSSNMKKTAGIVDQNGLRDASSKSKHIKKSPDVVELTDVDSPAFVSSSSYEENDSETGTAESDTLSFNGWSALQSSDKFAQTESVVECSKGDAELILGPDFRSSAVSVLKKRKPSRQGGNSATTNECIIDRFEKQPDSETEEHTAGQILPSNNWDAKYINGDGDEHLPLLKRARVRMGQPSSEVEEPDSLVQPVKKPSLVSDCNMVRLKAPSNSEVDSPLDRNPSVGLEVKKVFGFPSDVEAVLPPSKRIQRALEAMSANVAEDVQQTFKAPSSMRTFVNASCFSGVSDCYNMSSGNKSEGETILGSSTNLISLGVDKYPASNAEVKDCNIIFRGNHSPKPASCGTGVSVEVVDCSDRKREDILQPSVDNCQIVNLEAGKPFQENNPTRISAMNLDPVLANVGMINGLTHVDTDPLPCNLQNNCDTKNLSKLDTDKDNKDEGMFVLKEKTTVKDFEVFPSTPKEARPTSLQDVLHLLPSKSDLEDHSSCKDVSGIRSSPSLTGGPDSALVPHDDTSGCNVSAADNIVPYSNNGCCSVDAPSPHEYPKHAGKENGKVQASDTLESFKALLRSLTRTKDSIGCLTRIALKCGKLGISSEVVEVLACYLEREPSLPKRVDLFFLVDSIIQCSRGLKGEIGDLFSSAIQALLPRLLLAAAPPGSNGHENRRECLKVLRLWQERRVLPESVIYRHIQDLDSASVEQNFNDPPREVEGMVDKYGSNSSLQLLGSQMPKDEGCNSDGKNFEAVTPVHNSENVSPGEADLGSTGNVRVHIAEDSKHCFEQKSPVNFPPPPKNVAPSSPPQIATPPPLPLLPPPLSSALPNPMNECTQQYTAPCSAVPKVEPISLDGSSYQAPKNEDIGMSMQIPGTANTGSFGSVPVPHSPIRPMKSYSQIDGAISHSKTFHTRSYISESVNGRPSGGGVPVSRLPVQPLNSIPQVNGAFSHNKSIHLRPAQPAPSDHFSYVKVEHLTPAREIAPLSYPNRSPFLWNRERGNFYGDHGRFEAGPHDVGNIWSHSEPSFSGPNYHDVRRLPYAQGPYGRPLLEPPLPNHNWAFPPRAMNPREVTPHRPPLVGPNPVAIRGPTYWRPSPR
ncbi:protein HUA2-LIKE 3-like isoform X2 [Apium graveolens]|uniref:protein HUA2-LIKE 3-like isoform X2 n=1 Tax=Apium graveolens TaxID=4045 RepID=UPI003D7BA700